LWTLWRCGVELTVLLQDSLAVAGGVADLWTLWRCGVELTVLLQDSLAMAPPRVLVAAASGSNGAKSTSRLRHVGLAHH